MAEEAETLVTSSPLYKDRSEWKDIKPIYFTEDEEGAVKIAVTDACKVSESKALKKPLFSSRCICISSRYFANK